MLNEYLINIDLRIFLTMDIYIYIYIYDFMIKRMYEFIFVRNSNAKKKIDTMKNSGQ